MNKAAWCICFFLATLLTIFILKEKGVFGLDKAEFTSAVNGKRISIRKSNVDIVYEDDATMSTLTMAGNGNYYRVLLPYSVVMERLR